MRATAERAVLVRVSDRVWFLDAEETAFIPLAFYDRFRFLRTGSRIEVRGRGEYQAVMYDGSSVRSNGPSSITVVHMGEQEVVLQIDNLEQMWVTAALRPTRVRLPDGTELVFVDGQIRLENLGDRFRVSNEGSSVVTYSGSAGQGELDGPQFISVWKAPPDSDALAQQLQLSGDVAMVQGVEGTEVRGGRGGAVVVTGARFAVEQGSSLVIKPLGPPGTRE